MFKANITPAAQEHTINKIARILNFLSCFSNQNHRTIYIIATITKIAIAPPDFVNNKAAIGNTEATRYLKFCVCQHNIATIKYQIPEVLAY